MSRGNKKGSNNNRWKDHINVWTDEYSANYIKEWFRKNKKHCARRLREWRHKLNISKNYNSCTTGIKCSKKMHGQRYKALKKQGGELPIKRIQLVYEDNIKKYGTLTCYLCLKPIDFGKDHLEHKTPLSRGGTNEYNNLEVACQSCNCKKHNKTEKEFKEVTLV